MSDVWVKAYDQVKVSNFGENFSLFAFIVCVIQNTPVYIKSLYLPIYEN